MFLPHKSSRSRNPSKRFINLLLTENTEITILEFEQPTTYKQALMSEDSEKWLEAMRFEMESMSESQVWDLVGFPNGYTPIG